ncbi:MAG: HEPN domain-containing protein [Candidatus Hydrogenedentes bacterium]|nr:HEPN domain-containing protein [Candidatus Hydrogenedentota bacterium]
MTPVEQWLEKSQYDLETAHAMLEAARYSYVIFCCQQAIEKMLKAIITERTNKLPPRLHDLLRLSETAQVTLDADDAEFFCKLSDWYKESRYPVLEGRIGLVPNRANAIDRVPVEVRRLLPAVFVEVGTERAARDLLARFGGKWVMTWNFISLTPVN